MKIIRNHNVWFLVVAAISAACGSPNLRYAQFEDGCARAHLRDGEVYYHEIEIERPMGTSAPQVLFQLPNGKIIESRELTYEKLKGHGFRDSTTDYQPEYTDVLRGNGTLFFFRDDELLRIRLMDVSQLQGNGIGIGQEAGDSFYTLPLSQGEIENIFGLPIEMNDGHYW